jgi:hypothetical protein
MWQIPVHTNLCSDETTIQLLGISIEEPVTVVTDFFITIVCWFLFFNSSKRLPTNRVTILYRYFFFVMGLATLFGGIFGHAFCSVLGLQWKLPGWLLSMVAVMLAERASIIRSAYLMSPRVAQIFTVMNVFELTLLVSLTLYTRNFFFVEFHAFYGFVIVVGLFEFWHYRKTGNAGSKQLLLSVGVSFVAALVHILQIDLHTWFNATDLAHTIMSFNAWFLFRAVQKFD